MPTYFRKYVVENLPEKMLKNLLIHIRLFRMSVGLLCHPKKGKASRGRGVARQFKLTRIRESLQGGRKFPLANLLP